jgi:hypothetical protein
MKVREKIKGGKFPEKGEKCMSCARGEERREIRGRRELGSDFGLKLSREKTRPDLSIEGHEFDACWDRNWH